MPAKNQKFYPMAVNIMKLQKYTNYFALDEIVLFEWFMVKANSFSKDFFYSVRRIAEETNLKKARINTILKKFKSLDIISYEAKHMPRTYWYQVNREPVFELLPKIYKWTDEVIPKDEEEQDKLYDIRKLLTFFGKQLPETSKHKEYYKNSKQEEVRKEKNGLSSSQSSDDSFEAEHSNEASFLSEGSSATATITSPAEEDYNDFASLSSHIIEQDIVDLKLELAADHQVFLTSIYKERLEMHNENPRGRAEMKFANLAFTKKSKLLLADLFAQHTPEDIEASFTAFIDQVIRQQVKTVKPIAYFLAKNYDGEFSTFLTYLDIHNTQYRLS